MPIPDPKSWRASNRWLRPTVLFAGLLLPQIAEFGPSLVGAKVLLPLELLALPGIYLPDLPEYRGIEPGNSVNLDKVEQYEPARRFAAEEIRAGRYPKWFPYGHGGTPFILSPSPFVLMYLAVPDPITLAWIQLVKALLAGFGAFLFLRRSLEVGFWPAALGAWMFPLCGYMVYWQGHYLSDAAVWLPWVLSATHSAVRNPRGVGGPALGLSIGAQAIAGVTDVLAHSRCWHPGFMQSICRRPRTGARCAGQSFRRWLSWPRGLPASCWARACCCPRPTSPKRVLEYRAEPVASKSGLPLG